MLWRPKRSNKTVTWRFDSALQFQYWRHHNHRPEVKAQGDLIETMSFIGACMFLERKRFWDLGGMDELHGMITGEKEAEAANAYRTIPSGDYRLQVTNYRVSRDNREAFPSGDPNPNYGRVMVDLTIECSQEGQRKGVVFVTVSPEKKVTKEGYPDRFWAPWCSLVIALGLLIDNAIVVVDEVQQRLRSGVSAGQAVQQSVSYLLVQDGS
jgi:hypothetical protein